MFCTLLYWDTGQVLGLLSMLFEWYKVTQPALHTELTVNQVTATLPNDKSGTKVEKIKSDLVPPWLRRLSQRSPEIFVQCLIPRPESGARVGGHWEIRAPDTVVRHPILLRKYTD